MSFRSIPSTGVARIVALAASRLVALIGLAGSAGRSWSNRRHDDTAFAGLDAHALRDLGLSRSEVASFRCEAEGLVARTRLRVAHGGAGGAGPTGREHRSSRDWELPNRSIAARNRGRMLSRCPLPEA